MNFRVELAALSYVWFLVGYDGYAQVDDVQVQWLQGKSVTAMCNRPKSLPVTAVTTSVSGQPLGETIFEILSGDTERETALPKTPKLLSFHAA